jgi:choline kinase
VKHKKIASIVLAAGMSSRMKEGKTKCLKYISDNETIIERTLRQHKDDLSVIKTYISTGFESKRFEMYNSKNVETVFNEDYKKDKNIKSCFLCLDKLFNDNIEFDHVIISEGDVIISNEDIDNLKKLDIELGKDYIVVENINSSNQNRIGCIDKTNKIYLRENVNQTNDDRMSGIFILSFKTAKELRDIQKNILENTMGLYYFQPLTISFLNNCKYQFSRILFNKSFTVNNKEEFAWAKNQIN